MAMGQAAGAAAVLASTTKKTPIEIPIADLTRLIEEHGGIVPR
jgi:hypothetical protein